MYPRRARLMSCCRMAASVLAALVLVTLLPAVPAMAAATAQKKEPKTEQAPLKLCYIDIDQRPWSTPAGTGLNFELLRRVEKQLGEHFSYASKPWRRCLQELRLGKVDAIIAAADSPERREFGVVPMLPDGSADPARAVYSDTIHVFLRTGSGASWDGRQLRAPSNEVVVQSGYWIASVLRDAGLQPREAVKSAEDGLRLLSNGVYDAAVLQGMEAARMARHDPRFRERIQLQSTPYLLLPLYLTVNRNLHARDPARFEAIWRAIANVRQSAEYRQLLEEAGANHP